MFLTAVEESSPSGGEAGPGCDGGASARGRGTVRRQTAARHQHGHRSHGESTHQRTKTGSILACS